jgi:hypothetical protein
MKKLRGDTLYTRSFILTLGGLLLVLPVWIWMARGRQSNSWPLFAWGLFFSLPIAGICSLIFGAIALTMWLADFLPDELELVIRSSP